ncbi:MAG: hypothetical protein R6U98_27905, partial [Pirellulaceae bacterium]
SMRKQVDRILAAFNRLEITPQPPFHDVETLLPQQAPTNSDPPESWAVGQGKKQDRGMTRN